MVGVAGTLGAAVGIPLGILLYTTASGGIRPAGLFNRPLGWLVNAVRSTPFIILLVAIIPLTRLIAGTSIGTAAAIVPLTIAAAPLIARLVETSLREVDKGLIEAAQSMGATDLQIIVKVLIPEALPGIIAGLTIALVALVGASAMAGAIGNGIDRALYGYVVDMFELEFMHFAVFNIADIAINVCCILFVLLMLLRKEPEKPKET